MASDDELIRLLRLCAERAHRTSMEEWGGLIPDLTVEGRTEWLAANRLELLLTQNQRMREALDEIGRHGCETYNGGMTCRDTDRKKDARYEAEKWCNACIANDGLDRALGRHLPKATICP